MQKSVVMTWDAQTTAEWMARKMRASKVQEANIDKVMRVFVDNDICGSVLFDLSDAVLKDDLDIKQFGARQVILQILSRLY